MSNNLDKKLEEAIRYVANEDGYAEPSDLAEAITNVKRAFIDEGWSKVDQRQYRDGKNRKYQQYTFNGGYVRVPEFPVMTGQEFYDRFDETSIHAKDTVRLNEKGHGLYLMAAKKAAGLE